MQQINPSNSGAEYYVSFINKDDEANGAIDVPTEGETALVIYGDLSRKFDGIEHLILLGDHRKEYALFIDNFAACMSYYKAMAPTLRSKWSEDDNSMLLAMPRGEKLTLGLRILNAWASRLRG